MAAVETASLRPAATGLGTLRAAAAAAPSPCRRRLHAGVPLQPARYLLRWVINIAAFAVAAYLIPALMWTVSAVCSWPR